MKTLLRGFFFVSALMADGAAMAQSPMSLEQLFNLAEEQSRQLQSSRTAQSAADARVASARSQRLPDVNVSLSGSYIGNATLLSRSFSTNGTADVCYAIAPYVGTAQLGKQDTPHWGNQFAVEASQVLYAGGASTDGVRMAELGQQMAALDVEKQRQEVRFLLAGYYLDLFKLGNQQQVIQKNIELVEQQLQNMRSRLSEGTVLQSDITRFELLAENLRLAQRQVGDAAQIVGHQICTTLHIDHEIVPVADDEVRLYAEGEASLLQGETYWQKVADGSSIALKQASLACDISQQQLRVARSGSRPKVALVAEEHLSGPYTNDLIPVDANVNVWFVGLGVQYNLGSLWRNNHDMRRAKLDAQRSAEQLEVAREGIGNGVQACYVNFRTCQTDVQTQQKSVELANENYDVVNRRYAEGLALLTDLLDASSAKLTAEMALVNARINLIYNYYKLKYVTGTL